MKDTGVAYDREEVLHGTSSESIDIRLSGFVRRFTDALRRHNPDRKPFLTKEDVDRIMEERRRTGQR